MLRRRPALDARLDLLIALIGEADEIANTLAIDEVVREGLARKGLKPALDLALQSDVKTTEDLDALEQKLRPLMDALMRKSRMKAGTRRLEETQLTLEGPQMIAS